MDIYWALAILDGGGIRSWLSYRRGYWIMTVYVDSARIPYRRMKMCHMIADSEAELHEMAAAIGMRRSWYQHENSSCPHYDVSLTMRARAIERGAILIQQRAKFVARVRHIKYLISVGRWHIVDET